MDTIETLVVMLIGSIFFTSQSYRLDPALGIGVGLFCFSSMVYVAIKEVRRHK